MLCWRLSIAASEDVNNGDGDAVVEKKSRIQNDKGNRGLSYLTTTRNKEQVFLSTGFSNWKNALSKRTRHQNATNIYLLTLNKYNNLVVVSI